MINLLVLLELLISLVLDRGNIPDYRGLALQNFFGDDTGSRTHYGRGLHRRTTVLHQVFGIWKLSKSVVFESVSDDFNVTLVEIEIIPTIRRNVRSAVYRVLVNSKHKVFLSEPFWHINDWSLFKKHRWIGPRLRFCSLNRLGLLHLIFIFVSVEILTHILLSDLLLTPSPVILRIFSILILKQLLIIMLNILLLKQLIL